MSRPRLVPALIVGVGVIAAGVMVFLGLWQAQVFVDQGKDAATQATEGPPLTLDASVTGDGVGALWGRTVTVTGTYLPSQQVTVVSRDGTTRVVTALLMADGRVVAVARGVGTGTEVPPQGSLTQTGVFLPTQNQPDWDVPTGSYGTVRLQSLAQVWPQPLVAGYVTLTPAEATAQGLQPAPVELPTYEGRARNSGYAIQWWVFACFALGMSILIARNYGRRGLALADPLPDAFDAVDVGRVAEPTEKERQ